MGRNHGIRLIDADELKDNIKKWLTVDPTESRLVDIDDIAVSVLMEIDEAHTVDVQPVIHAEWIFYGRDSAYTRFFRCSRCNYEIPVYEDAEENLYNYCPHCGARMDGGNK